MVDYTNLRLDIYHHFIAVVVLFCFGFVLRFFLCVCVFLCFFFFWGGGVLSCIFSPFYALDRSFMSTPF